MWVKLLQDHDTHKKDAVIDIDDKVGESLITLKLAEKAASPEKGVMEKHLDTLNDNIEKLISKSFEATIEKVNKGLSGKIPAMPIDHVEAGQNGFKNFAEYLNCVAKSAGPGRGVLDSPFDPRLKGTPSGQNVANDAEGGYLVPETFAAGIMERLNGNESFMADTDRFTTSSDNMNMVTMIETSRKDGYRHNGALAYWMDEADAFTSSKLKFGKMKMRLHKLGALMYVTEEMLDDSQYAIAPIMQRKMADAIMFAVNDAIMDGSGVGMPVGLFRADAAIRINSGAGAEDGINHTTLSAMFNAMHPRYRSRAKWYMHPNMFEKLEFITFNNNGTTPIMRAGILENSLTGAPVFTIYGRPVVVTEHAKDLGDVGDIMFADLSQYMTLTKVGGGIKTAESIHLRFLYEEKAFRASFRVDGQPTWSAPVEDYNGSRLRSAYVLLNARNSGASSSGL